MTSIGMIRTFDVTEANVSDIKMLPELSREDNACCILGDKGYRSKPLAQELFEKQNVVLHTTVRSNEKMPQLTEPLLHERLNGMRRLIETLRPAGTTFSYQNHLGEGSLAFD